MLIFGGGYLCRPKAYDSPGGYSGSDPAAEEKTDLKTNAVPLMPNSPDKNTPRVDSRTAWRTVRMFLADLFNLHEDQASERETIEEVRTQTVFRGTNLWILIFAVMICSVGLNVNSPAVVIGAMLISPIMGPIMGVGMGMGINDFQLILKALKNLAVAAGFSIAASALYFYISPLSDAQSELLARTEPTIWDVLIAFFGGMAGIIAGSRREKSNAIPGVAIATALMPPLCTAGFGLGTGQWNYFFGAFYLFFINCLFISLATVIFVRFLRFPKKEFVDPARETRVKRYIFAFVVLSVIPSVYTGYNVVRESVFMRQANAFIESQFLFDNTQVLDRRVTYNRGGQPEIRLTLFGEQISEEALVNIEQKLHDFRLDSTRLIIRQTGAGRNDGDGIDLETVQRMTAQTRQDILEDLYARNQQVIEDKDARIALLENELLQARNRMSIEELAREARAIDPLLTTITMNSTVIANAETGTRDTVALAVLSFQRSPNTGQIERMRNWLQARTDQETVKVVVE